MVAISSPVGDFAGSTNLALGDRHRQAHPGRHGDGREKIVPGTQTRSSKRDRGSRTSAWLKRGEEDDTR